MTPQELKNSILQLAIQGKLVEHRVEEGTAEELYAEIQKEKAKLIKEGKIKKEKLLSEIAEDEKPFDIPDSWMWVRFGELAQLLDGVKLEGKAYPYLEAKYLRGKSEPTMLNEGKFVSKGTRIILVDGENSGEVFKAIEDGYMGSTFKVLFFPDTLIEEYVLSYLSYYQDDYRNNKRGAAIPHLNKELFFGTLFPLPPLAEQKRIVAKIEELLPLIDRYEQAWSKLEDFNKRFPTDMQKSILQMAIEGKLVEQRPEEGTGEDLYREIQAEKQKLIKSGKIKKDKPLPEITDDEKPFDIPSNWVWVRFGEFGNYKKGPFGSALTKNLFVPKSETTIKVYEQKNAIQKDATLGEYYITRQYFDESMKGFEVEPGDIIVSCAGTIGETYILPDRIEKGIINQALMRMRLYSPVYVPYFLMYFDVVLKQNAQTNSKGSAIKNIPPFDILKNYLVPLPPLAEQKRIVEKLNQLLPLCERLK